MNSLHNITAHQDKPNKPNKFNKIPVKSAFKIQNSEFKIQCNVISHRLTSVRIILTAEGADYADNVFLGSFIWTGWINYLLVILVGIRIYLTGE